MIIFTQLLKSVDNGSLATIHGIARQTYDGFPLSRQSEPTPLFNIVWLRPIFAISHRLTQEEKLFRGFDTCEYRNCNITYTNDTSEAARGDAVIFPGRFLGPKFIFKRPPGQVWIFFELEAPVAMAEKGNYWQRRPWKSQFNWTMTYDTSTADISFKYGDLRLKPTYPERNYTAIALNKTGDVLIINSHCPTNSKRETYIAKLGRYISVSILGNCGRKWKCGRRFVHDDCFKILNHFRYYLAFENALCKQYITEKVFNNFDYDTVLVTRGGDKQGDVKNVLPEGTYISTEDFGSVKALADHLKQLSSSVTEYAEMLKRKDRYYNVGFAAIYKQAMCDICKRMNRQDEYRQTIPDMGKRWFRTQSCRQPRDIR